ncbi:unnamed protein product, partial [Didymodactylos carnosus]
MQGLFPPKCIKIDGMRKEWIMTDEEKQMKKQKIETNRRLKELSVNYQTYVDNSDQASSDTVSPDTNVLPQSLFSVSLTQSDWTKLHDIQTAYTNAVKMNSVEGLHRYPSIETFSSTDQLINIPTNIASLRLIAYIKQIPEFQTLNEDDKVTLVKYNILAAIFMHGVLIYDPLNDTFHEHNTDDYLFDAKDFITTISLDFYQQTTYVMKDLIQIVEHDRMIVKILIIILICSKGFCAYEYMQEPILNNTINVYNVQNIYIDLLWLYCSNQFGYWRTVNLFSKLLTRFMSIQILA